MLGHNAEISEIQKLYARSHREDLELESGSITLKGGLWPSATCPEWDHEGPILAPNPVIL